jgi:hypothetical protein
MRILIDECVDPRVTQLFNDHEAVTVHDLGWGALEDGSLLKVAQESLIFSSLSTAVSNSSRILQNFESAFSLFTCLRIRSHIIERSGRNCWRRFQEFAGARYCTSPRRRFDRGDANSRPTLRLAFRDDLQQAIRGRRDLPDSRIECLLVSLRGLAVPADLAHELERRRCYLLRGSRRRFTPKDFNAAAHSRLPKIFA